MPNTVRVKDPVSGAEYDVPRSRLAVCPDLQVIDKPTGDRPKPRLPLGQPIPGGHVDRDRRQKTSATDKPPADQNDGQPVATPKEK